MTQADLDLIHAFVADQIGPDDFPRLESLLRSSRSARRAVIGLTAVEEGLEQIAATEFSARFFGKGTPAPKPVTPPSSLFASTFGSIGDAFAAAIGLVRGPRDLIKILLPLAAVICGVLLVMAAWQSLLNTGRPRLPAGVLAQVVALSRVEWSADAPPRHEGDSLQTGGLVSLERGLAEIVFACGATAVLEGPATFEIIDGASGRLGRGQLAATLDRPTGPFAIHTPSAVVTDRGTQFGVEVDEKGKTDVRVFQGLVELAMLATLGTGEPLVLKAGEAAEVDAGGRIARLDAAAPKKFVLAVPKPVAPRTKRPLPFAWDDATAVTIYRDSFSGDGPLDSTFAASRGGVGAVAWTAAQEGWRLNPATKSLDVTTTGAAFLPFTPEPGHRYRLSVAMDVTDGGIGWAALGFASSANTRLATLDHAWMLQRHETKTQANAAYKGPQMAGVLPRGDRLTGLQTRTVVLDTTAPRWKAFFLVGDELIGQCDFDQPAEKIAHVAISVFPNTVARFRDFSLQAIRITR